MKCSMCKNRKPLKKELRTIKFDSCGLDNVTLRGVPVYACPECGEVYEEIPKLQELLDIIAGVIMAKKGLLTPNEAVFLRKYLGYSRTQMAEKLGYAYETLNRLENGNRQNPISPKFDRSLRSLVAKKAECGDYQELDETSRLVLRAGGNGWKIAS